MADLITIDRLYNALNVTATDLTPGEVENYEAAITAASVAVQDFVDRTFEPATGIPSERSYEYDGSGYLDIDDAVAVTLVTYLGFNGTPLPLDVRVWSAQPHGKLPYTYIKLNTPPNVLISPEMGFTYNLDTYEGRGLPPQMLTLTGDWGWPGEPPAPVQQAVVITAAGFTENPRSYSEAIAGYSHSSTGVDASSGIPERAKSLLIPYIKQKV